MRDLYQQLGVPDNADDAVIRAALSTTTDPSVREAANLILLDARRREVYDRNRRLLQTVGRLRANLGLNLTRFWPRARFQDFTIDLSPPPPRQRRVLDPMAMAWAFGVRPADSTRTRDGISWITVAAAGLMVSFTALALWWWLRFRDHG